MEVQAKKAAKQQSKDHLHGTLGRIWVTKATKQAYLQTLVKGRKVMLVGVTKSQADQSPASEGHNSIIETLAEIAVEHTLDKPNLVAYRDEWLKTGVQPF